MARMTRNQAATKLRELDHAIRRLEAVTYGRTVPMVPEARATYRGKVHELTEMRLLLDEVVQGLGAAHTDPETVTAHGTTREALALVLPKAGSQRARVLDTLAPWCWKQNAGKWHGLTDVQLSMKTGMPANTVRPRRGELVTAGLVEDSGRRRKHDGRQHIVWTLTEAARHTVGVTTTDDDGNPHAPTD